MRISSCSIVLLLLAISFNASGLMMIVEGHARLSVVLITDNIIVVAKDVSGAEEEEVFGIDTTTRTIPWRFNAKRVADIAVVDTGNAFYMFADNCLQKRDLRTGSLLWSTKLDSIPQQNTAPRVTLRERVENLLDKAGFKTSLKPTAPVRIRGLGGTPNRYQYKPVLSRSMLAVFREATHSTGCIVSSCFSDWITFDPKTGRRIFGGSGDLLGTSGAVTLFADQAMLWTMAEGKMAELDSPQGTAPTVQSWLRYRSGNDQFSSNGRCIFEDNFNGVPQICVFDKEKREVVSFSAPVVSDFQMNWVLLDEHLLHYSECIRYSEEGMKTGRPFFELYNLKGEYMARAELKGTNDRWYLSFLGTTKTGKALFENGSQHVLVDVPSLKLTSFSVQLDKGDRAKDGYSYPSIYMRRGTAYFYVTEGNATISRMPPEEKAHELRISAVDAETGKKAWQHIERVTIKKIKGR